MTDELAYHVCRPRIDQDIASAVLDYIAAVGTMAFNADVPRDHPTLVMGRELREHIQEASDGN